MAAPCGGHFFRMTLHFSKSKRKKNPTLPEDFNLFDILYYFSSLRCCAHHEDNIYNPYTTETCSLKNANQKKEKSISDILVMARPRSVWYLANHWQTSSSELMNARMTSLESSSSPGLVISLSYSSLALSSVSLLSGLALLSFCVNVLAFLGVGWLALSGLFCCKHERLSID